jgi:hypothetical protein
MEHPDKQHALEASLTGIRIDSPGIPNSRVRKGLRLAGIVFMIFVSFLFIGVGFVSAKPAAIDTNTFCTEVTDYGGIPHCQTGDKTIFGWYAPKMTPPPLVPPIASLKVRNFAHNPGSAGKLTIYTPQLYCASYWSDFIGHGYVEVNGQRFATCRGDERNLGPGGFNYGADYLFVKADMVRIITNITVSYGQTLVIKIYGRIYAATHDDCRKEERRRCLYPGISPGWVYAYTKTDTRKSNLANFYRAHKTVGKKPIYDFLTINYGDLDSDDIVYDYYDFDDLWMTFALTGK